LRRIRRGPRSSHRSRLLQARRASGGHLLSSHAESPAALLEANVGATDARCVLGGCPPFHTVLLPGEVSALARSPPRSQLGTKWAPTRKKRGGTCGKNWRNRLIRVVARGGIEPPKRGFSVRLSKRVKF